MALAVTLPNVAPTWWHERYSNIPTELREKNVWLRWKLEERDGKLTKVPYKASGDGFAKTNDPSTWSSFEDAAKNKFGSGLGVVIQDDLVCIDLDKVRNPETGEIEPWAQAVIDECQSYTELSPSNKGVHIWVKGSVPEGGYRRGRIEMYDLHSPRYMSVTGARLNELPIRAYDLTSIHQRMLNGLDPQKQETVQQATGHSQSEADFAYVCKLVRQGKTVAQIKEAMAASPLFRVKWARKDYADMTIAKAFATSGVVAPTVNRDPLARERMEAVKAEKIEWLWEGRFPLGMVISLIGQGGVGKSMFTEEIAARVSTGQNYPDGAQNTLPPSDVLLMNNEDSPGASIRPRLEAAHADLSKIIRVKLEETGFSADKDIVRLEETLKAEPNVRLLIIDPIADMLGDTNNNSASEVRQKVLSPLSKMAAKYNVCVVVCCHTNKKEGMSAINRVDGSQAYVSGVRGSWMMLPWDEDDELGDGEKGIVLQFNKSNCFQNKKGLKGKIVPANFSLPDGEIGTTARIVWMGETDKSAQETLDAVTDPEARKSKKCLAWLRELLTREGETSASEIFKIAKEEGFNDTAIHRASAKLKVVKTHGAKTGGRSHWSLPDCA